MYVAKDDEYYRAVMISQKKSLRPTIHECGGELFTQDLVRFDRLTHRPELSEGLSEYAEAFH